MKRQRKQCDILERQRGNCVHAELSEAEWNFDSSRVPENEVIVCCYWEYARESPFILSVRERCRRIRGRKLTFTERQKFVGADFREIRHVLGRAAHLFQEGIYSLGGTKLYDEAVSPFPQPWQLLSKEIQCILMETAAWTPSVLQEFPPFRWSRFVSAPALAEHLRRLHPHPKNPKFLLEPNTGSSDDHFWSGNVLRTDRPSLMSANGTEILLVEIEWGSFPNRQIVDCFRKWVRIHRPKNVKEPSGRGHKLNDWRVLLDRLAIMRLLHHSTVKEMPEKFPIAWKRYGERKAVVPGKQKDYGGVDWYRERVNANREFHRLFPFLGGELPLSWRTKGGRR